VMMEIGQAVPRVDAHAKVTGQERYAIDHKDQPVLVEDHVRHCGDAVALVLAQDQERLRQALALIRLDLEPLPGVFEVQQALQPDAPQLHERGRADAEYRRTVAGNLLLRLSELV